MVFLRDESAREAIEDACRAEGLEPLEWREVPVEPDALGESALATMPRIEQLLSPFRAATRRPPSAPAAAPSGRPGAYIASLSFRTVTYKALCAAEQLARFYPDLGDPELAVPFGIFHQRFSTNTAPSWERAQPFRLLCHNGEINAIQGNVNWMRAREGNFGSEDDELLHPVIDESGSDSAMLDNALELLVRRGRDVRHALAMLVPEAWEGNDELDAAAARLLPLPLAARRAVGRAGRPRVHGRPRGRRGARPQRAAAAALRRLRGRPGRVLLRGRRGRPRRAGPGAAGAARPGPDRRRRPGARLRGGTREIKRELAGAGPTAAGSPTGCCRGRDGRPWTRRTGDLTARQARFGYTRED